MKTGKYFVTICLVLALVIMVWAQPVPAQPQYGGVFTWNHNGGVPQIGAPADNLGFSVGNRNSFPALEPLLITYENDRIQPGLAESWNVSPDGKTIIGYAGLNFRMQTLTPRPLNTT
jgi:ABC-type transport system substrate-binding protein